MRITGRQLLVLLGLLGLMLRAVAGTPGVGQMLCIGCEGAWWNASRSCGVPKNDCCDGESHEKAGLVSASVSGPIAGNDPACNCTQLALPSGVTTLTAKQVVELPPVVLEVLAVLCVQPELVASVASAPVSNAREGPPRVLRPRQRFTVLVV